MNTHFSCSDAKKIDMAEYLEILGFKPQKVRNNDYWYYSPLRQEDTPSFKINRKLNVWYDHGLGRGGCIIEFGTLYYNCSISELLQKLKRYFSSHQQLSFHVGLPEKNSSIRVIKVGEINSLALQNYLAQRRIPIKLAEQNCKQIEYDLNGNLFTAIGFKNNADGYELRSQYFKGSASPKDVSFIDSSAKELAVLEGFFRLSITLGS